VTDAVIVDTAGVVRAAADRALEGQPLPPREDLATVVDAPGLFDQLRAIYGQGGRTLEVRQPLLLGDEAFGSIHIGVSTVLMRQELNASLRPALNIALGALVVAVFVGVLLAQLLLKPIHVIRSGLTRLGKGEFGVTLDLPPGDEFGELGTFFNTVSQQLSADRSTREDQQASLQSAVEHLEDAVALFNPAGELLFSNPAMQPALQADAIGRPVGTLFPTGHPYRALIEESLARRQSMGPVQAARPGAAGSPTGPTSSDSTGTELLLMTHAIVGNTGELVGVMLVARDVQYLSRMQSTLAYSRKLVALGRLTAGIAHEVKNPLNAMMIHLELLRTKIRAVAAPAVSTPRASTAGGLGLAAAESGPDVSGALDHVEVIEHEIRRLDEVVQGFLKFTRPEDLTLQPVRVATLFEEILPLIRPEAESHGVRVDVEAPPDMTVNGDASMLRQALLNLAQNACQAMPQGGALTLRCGAASQHRVEIRVGDTGVGIAPEHLGKIFDLYFTTKERGTGIGLSMVYRIVQLHDGDIEVESTPGRGTTFRILLPRVTGRWLV
jgi:signal transduction histidine kinase